MLRKLAIGAVALALGIIVLPMDRAAAQSCRAILRELAAAEGGGGGGRNSRYERAFQEQAAVLNRTERQARQAGCFGGDFLFFRARPQRVCRSLIPKLRQMQANLGKLDRLRRQGGGRAADRRRVRALQAMYQDRGCDGSRQLQARREVDQETLSEPDMSFQGGRTFRTLCVRTCDGYYFPVSFSTTRSQFAYDSQTCQAMCPGAAAELYYHSNPGSGPEEMVSVSGVPYASLPTAFQYRKSLNPSCTCKSASGNSYALIQTQIPANAQPSAPEQQARKLPALPLVRPPPGEDPETLANLAGGFVPRAVAEPGATLTAEAEAGNERPVRVVGPVYWGAREKEGVVLTPVPN